MKLIYFYRPKFQIANKEWKLIKQLWKIFYTAKSTSSRYFLNFVLFCFFYFLSMIPRIPLSHPFLFIQEKRIYPFLPWLILLHIVLFKYLFSYSFFRSFHLFLLFPCFDVIKFSHWKLKGSSFFIIKDFSVLQ